MKFIIFDIDGTILDSVNADDECFIQIFKDLHQIDLSNTNWNDFKNVTDWGLTNEIFEKEFGRLPTQEEISKTQDHFYNLLKEKTADFIEIPGVRDFIQYLEEDSNYEIAFATGGWEKTAKLKCSTVGLNLAKYIYKTSDDHFNRAKIIELAIEETKQKHGTEEFESITYIGDGLWDLKATQKMNIDFIGVDYHSNDRLKIAGAKNIIKTYKT